MTRYLPHAVFAALAIGAAGVGTWIATAVPLPDGANDFNSPGFVVRHAWVKVAYAGAAPLRAGTSPTEEDAAVARYFELNELIGDAERIAGDPASSAADAASGRYEAHALRDERARIENAVETTLEARLSDAIREAGLTRRVGRAIVWPPVDIELTEPPAVLVVSPRFEIRRDGETLLQGDLALGRIERIEADAERDGRTSALVVQVAGVAMYPSIIPRDAGYERTMRLAAHEWMHHYLYFAPLGRRYFEGGDLRTLNETLADIAGDELAAIVLTQHPASTTAASRSNEPVTADGEIDFVAEMRDLRRRVEARLARGETLEAELMMEEMRLFLAEHGYYIRRLNQAYFAFHGSYATGAASIDPIGPTLTELRARSASLREFVHVAREFTSAEDLERALAGRE